MTANAFRTRAARSSADPAWMDLRRAFQEINAEKEFGPLLTTVLNLACRMYRAEGAALLLANRNSGLLEVGAFERVAEEALEAYRSQPARTQALENGALDTSTSEDWNRIRALASGYAQPVIMPIHLQQKIIGCLILAAGRFGNPSPRRQEHLELFLEYIAQAIENAYLIFQLKQQNGRLELMMTRLQNTQNSLQRAEKMALAGKIAASVAHEIRNPLTVIGANLQLVFEKMATTHPDRELYAVMLDKVRAVDQTIKELLVLARPVALRLQAVSLPAAIAQVSTFIEKKYAARHIALAVDLPADLPLVYADDEQLQRSLINLFLNAYQVLPEGGKVSLRAQTADGDSWVELFFADNGPGIAPEKASQIFEPFFTTRDEGTGLGLFLVKSRLEEMNGSIELVGRAGEGAMFKIRLPVAGRTPSEPVRR